jgi:hypothetical protein
VRVVKLDGSIRQRLLLKPLGGGNVLHLVFVDCIARMRGRW